MHFVLTGIDRPDGLYLAHDLLAGGHSVHAIGPETAAPEHLPAWARPRLTVQHLDPGRDEGWTRALRGVEAVIHAADPDPSITRRVLRSARDAGVPRVLVRAPLAVPTARAGELDSIAFAGDFAAGEGIATTIFRTGLLVGPPLGSMTDGMTLIDRIRRRRRVFLPAIEMPILDIRDLARAHLAALARSDSIGEGYVLAAGTLPARELPRFLREETGRRRVTLPLPRALWRLDPILGPYARPPAEYGPGPSALGLAAASPRDAVRATIRALEGG